MAADGALWWRGEADRGCISLALLFTTWLCLTSGKYMTDVRKKSLKRKLDLPMAKESNFLLRLLAWPGINFLCFLSCLGQNEFRIFFPLLQGHGVELDSSCCSWSVPINLWLFVWFFPFCSYRTRCWIILNAAAVANSGWWPSLKRRRTTKIRRLIVAWHCRVPTLLVHCVSLSHQCAHTITYSLSLSSHVLSFFCFLCICLFLEV